MKTKIQQFEEKEIDLKGFFTNGSSLFSVTDTTVIKVFVLDEYAMITIDKSISPYDTPSMFTPITATEFIDAYGKARNMQGAAFAEAIRSISPEAIKDVNLTWHPIAY